MLEDEYPELLERLRTASLGEVAELGDCFGCLGGANVRADGNIHANVTCRTGA